MRELLVADCVSKAFGGRRILTSATLRAVPGRLTVLFGRNGAGKSTLLRIAAGWTRPDSGTVHYDGRPRTSARLSSLARDGVFYLPDHDLFSSAYTIGVQLEMFRRRFDGAEPGAAMARVELDPVRMRERPEALSGGERRRAELAAILVRRPRCLLADEPYRGVAPRDADVLTATFRALASEGCAVVVTGHEVPTLMAAADHVTWSTAGTTYELGPPAVAQRDERFRAEYLGTGRRVDGIRTPAPMPS